MKPLLAAFAFLTVLPVSSGHSTERRPISGAVWFPFVGLVLGALLAATALVATALFPDTLAAVLTVAVWALLTGALHLDGVADTCDALALSAPPSKRLEVLRDPRTGAFGAAGLVLLLMVKSAAVLAVLEGADIQERSAPLLVAPLVVAPMASRWLALGLARWIPPPPGGAGRLGDALQRDLSRRTLAASSLGPGIVIAAVGWRAAAGTALAAAAVAVLGGIARRRLGGVNGDILGCGIEGAEVVVLAAFVVFTDGAAV